MIKLDLLGRDAAHKHGDDQVDHYTVYFDDIDPNLRRADLETVHVHV